MSVILDWIFEGIVNWIASIVTQVMDAVSGIFLNALGTDMVAMEEYFPFVTRAFSIMQYMAWCILFLITIWQLFRVFGGPITEAENPWHLLARSTLFALLIGYAKPIFSIILDIARAPYTALMDASMNPGDFTFAGIENVLSNGITTMVAVISVVGLLLMIILMLCLGWNYFKLLLEVVERYIVVGVLCYTSPLAFAMGGSKATNKVFQSWCRMVGSQLLLLVLNVWFLRAFNSSVGQFTANGGALTSGHGNIFLWMFCALAFLKTAQKFDSYLASMGLNVAQTGSGMGMELMMASRILTGFGGGSIGKTAGNIFRGGANAAGAAGAAGAGGFASGFASMFKGNSYVRDAVVQGGSKMGAGGGLGFVGRAFGGMAARTGATLTGESIASVATRPPAASGSIAGDIADRSLSNYMPQLAGKKLNGTQITGGQISTTAIGASGKESAVQMYSAAQYDKPDTPHSVVKASDGSTWYQTASGAGMGDFYGAPAFSGDASEASKVAAAFPDAGDGTMLRTVDDGVMEATTADGGNSMWYNSAFYQEPDAPHDTIASSDGVSWYAMQPHAETPYFDTGEDSGYGGVTQGSGTIADSGMGMPQNEASFEPGTINETSTLTGGVGAADMHGVESGSIDSAELGSFQSLFGGSSPDSSAPYETSTLQDGIGSMPQAGHIETGELADSGLAAGGMSIPQSGAYHEPGTINETSTLTGGDGPTAVPGSDPGSFSSADTASFHPSISGGAPDSSAPHETSSLQDSIGAMPQGGAYYESGAINETSTLTGGAEPAAVHGSDSGRFESSEAGSFSSVLSGYSQDSYAPHETSTLQDGIGAIPQSGHTEGGGAAPQGVGAYQEPAALQDVPTMSGGVTPSFVQPNINASSFDPAAIAEYNQAQFQQYMPGYEQQVSQVNAARKDDGMIEVRHKDGTGTAFYDKTMYQAPRGDYQVYEDKKGGQWYAIQGTPAVERRPVYENGKPVYDGDKMKTVEVESVRYKTSLSRFDGPKKRDPQDRKAPKKKS